LRGRIYSTNNKNNTNQEALSLLSYGEYLGQYKWRENLTVSGGLSASKTKVSGDLYSDQQSSNYAAYVQTDYKYNRWNLSAGYRYEGGEISGIKFKPQQLMRAGVNFKAAEATYLRAAYGQGFRFPTIAEKYIRTQVGSIVIYPNDSLITERGTSYEFGLRQGFKIKSWLGFIDASVWQNIPSGWYYITIEDNVCSVSDSAFVDLLDPPVAQFSASVTEGCDPINVTFTNTSQNAQTYAWDFGNGQTSNSAGPVSMTYDASQGSYVVTLTALQGAQCTDQASTAITVFICGCTNPEAINYNPLATVDDGTCIIPEPEVFAPNVFTPNLDNNNEAFFLSTKNVTTLQLTILNRWGNVVFERSSVDLINNNPSWDGTIDGQLATEGIYFYTYVATGINGQEVKGHGFMHLANKK
jgi:gliding motility-associated-like protein